MTSAVDRALHVSFRQHDGEMVGRCWCGRTHSSPDPRDMWAWLDDHVHAGSEAGPEPGAPELDGPVR